MSYTQQNLTDGTVLTAAHLNHVDDGIGNAEVAAVAAVSSVAAVETRLQPATEGTATLQSSEP